MFNKLNMVSNKNPKEDQLKEDTDKTVFSSAKNKGKKAKKAGKPKATPHSKK